jgi:hypothetical protein
MQERPFLSKRSSFSNFSSFKSPPSPGSRARNGDDAQPPASSAAQGFNYRDQSGSGIGVMNNGSSNSPYGYPTIPPYQSHTQTQPRTGRSAHYESHWPLYTADWTSLGWTNTDLVAVGTFSEDQNNRVCEDYVDVDGSW